VKYSLEEKLRLQFKLFKSNNKTQIQKRMFQNLNWKNRSQTEVYPKGKFLKKDFLALNNSIYENMKSNKKNVN